MLYLQGHDVSDQDPGSWRLGGAGPRPGPGCPAPPHHCRPPHGQRTKTKMPRHAAVYPDWVLVKNIFYIRVINLGYCYEGVPDIKPPSPFCITFARLQPVRGPLRAVCRLGSRLTMGQLFYRKSLFLFHLHFQTRMKNFPNMGFEMTNNLYFFSESVETPVFLLPILTIYEYPPM